MALAPALDLRRPPVDVAGPASVAPWWREPPQEDKPIASVEAEQALLGVLLYAPEILQHFQAELLPSHFFEPFHGRLYTAIVQTIEAGETPDPTFLAEEFRLDRAYIELGEVRYLADLVDRAPPAPRARDYARHIIEMHNKRRLLDLSNEIGAAVRAGAVGADDILSLVVANAASIRAGSARPVEMVTARAAAIMALDEIEVEANSGKPRGVHTGLDCFDDRLGGLIPTWLITIGGRPGMGKTALLRAGLYGAADRNRNRTFAMFSLESPNRELSERAISAATTWGMDTVDARQSDGGIQTRALSRSKVGMTEMPRLRAAVDRLPDNLFLFDRPDLGLHDVVRAVWQMKARGDLAAIGIDYLQLMRREEVRGRNDAALIGDITTGLKRLAMEAQIAVLLVSQLNRGVDTRDDKRPVLADLRESGSIEQDSNAVMFPYREAYYLARSEPKAGTPEFLEWEMKLSEVRDLMVVHTAKLRQGEPGANRQTFLPEFDVVTYWDKN